MPDRVVNMPCHACLAVRDGDKCWPFSCGSVAAASARPGIPTGWLGLPEGRGCHVEEVIYRLDTDGEIPAAGLPLMTPSSLPSS
jgi:hypothetical protein